MFGRKKETDREAMLTSGRIHEAEKRRNSLKRRLAPDGIGPNSLDHFYINDMGHDCFMRSFTIEKLPGTVTFASTFAQLFNSTKVSSSVYIKPMAASESQRLIERKMRSDETELLEAQKAGETYRVVKMQDLFEADKELASLLESGQSKWYEVGFLFTIMRDSLEQLNLASSDFVSLAKETGIELSSCYGMQAEAFLSNGPYNKIYKGALSVVGSSPVKMHVFDAEGLASIFNHTNTYFSHPNGIPIGRNLTTGEPILWDPYDKSHNGYSCAFVGKVGTGKSATIKMFIRRLGHFDFRFACIDTEKSGGCGEYSRICDEMGGVNFELKTNSSNKLNIFELDEQLEYDTRLKKEFRALRLTDKCSEVKNVIMSAVTNSGVQPDYVLQTAMETILLQCIRALYEAREIYDNKPDSLYETETAAGRTKKELPTMSEAYLWVMWAARQNKIQEHVTAYQMLIDTLSDMVDSLYYDADTFETVTEEEFNLRQMTGRNLRYVNGTKGYFDGQSTMKVDRNTPFINIDISDIPNSDKLLGQQVAMNFLVENFIKKNSEDVAHAQKIVMIVDEAHRMFPNPLTRKFISDQVRTARKNNAGVWICTQNHRDFAAYEETQSILKNVSSLFMLKQDASDAQYLRENTILTPSAVSRVLSLGGDPNDIDDKSHKGEICLIDTDKTVFVKVDYLKESEAYFVETNAEIRKSIEAAENQK